MIKAKDKVLIVGNGPRLIKSCDILQHWDGKVVRFNDGVNFKQIPNRVNDLWTTINYRYHSDVNPDRVFYHEWDMNDIRNNQNFLALRERFGLIVYPVTSIMLDLSQKQVGYKSPSTGIIAICYYLSYIDSVYIIGFDSSHERASGRSVKKSCHQWDKEQELLKRLDEDGKVVILDKEDLDVKRNG